MGYRHTLFRCTDSPRLVTISSGLYCWGGVVVEPSVVDDVELVVELSL